MKKIVSPLANGGAPWSDDYLLTIQDQLYLALESLLSGIVPTTATGNVGVIISGCLVTGTGPYNCSSGIVYLNGTFMYFPGFSAQTLPQYIVPNTPIVVTDTWGNGTVNNFTSDQQATYQNTVPGSGQYLSLTTAGNQGGLGGYRLYQPNTQWTNLTLINSWTAYSGGAVPKYRVEPSGRVTISIYGVDGNSAATSPVICSLPAAITPLNDLTFPAFIANTSLLSTTKSFSVSSSGNISIVSYANTDELRNYSITYWLDS